VAAQLKPANEGLVNNQTSNLTSLIMSDRKSKDDGTPFGTIHQAAARGRIETIKVLIESGANPNEVDQCGMGPLHFAAEKGHWNIARLLLEKGATPGLVDGSCMTSLDYAVAGGYLEIARLLLECDALLADRFTGKGSYPIHVATTREDIPMIQLLLGAKIRITANDLHSRNPVHLAVKQGNLDICRLLLEYEARHPPTGLSRIFDGKLSVLRKDSNDHFPLFYAVESGNCPMVELLLCTSAASPKACDWYKKRLFHEAVKLGNLEMVEIFLKNGAPVNLKGRDSTSALHIAAYEGDVKMTQLLLKWGASTTRKDGGLSTPEQVSRNAEVTTILRSHGQGSRSSKESQKKDSKNSKSAVSSPPPEYSAARPSIQPDLKK
jgi:ankyrin repeat protein